MIDYAKEILEGLDALAPDVYPQKNRLRAAIEAAVRRIEREHGELLPSDSNTWLCQCNTTNFVSQECQSREAALREIWEALIK